mmetsp:Transcript_2901/g.13553  ORF Transcript_2901/g.13553 Transcript_2901/m.13553 type:complete len:739 (-) Transcript_2901:3069-5285(-)
MAQPAPQRLKSAVADLSEYFTEKTRAKFEKISAAMLKTDDNSLGFSKDGISPHNLSKLTSEILRYMDTYYGVKAAKNFRRFTKIPIRMFKDYSVNGSLHVILATILEHFYSIRKVDLSKRRDDLVDVFLYIERLLKKNGLLREMKLTCKDPSIRKVVDSVAKKKGYKVVPIHECTHLVYPDPPGTTEEETAAMEYCRTLRITEDKALVHWWYYPDSYDTWIPASEVQGEAEEPDASKDPWHVQVRWLQDTDKYNEVMNEADYEIPAESQVPAPRASPDAMQSSVQSAVQKRPREEGDDLVNSKPTKQSKTSDELQKQASLKVLVKMPKLDSPRDGSNDEKDPPETEALHEPETPAQPPHTHGLVDYIRAEQIREDFVPGRVRNISLLTAVRRRAHVSSHAAPTNAPALGKISRSPAWFSTESIHRIERRAFPDLLSGHFALKSPTSYKMIRNKIVDAWTSSPTRYLSPSAIKLEVEAETTSVVRIHNFLEQWGVINSSVRSSFMSGDSSVIRSVNFVYANLGEAMHAASPKCWTCSKDLEGSFMRCTTNQGEVLICTKCFSSGRFPSATSSRDFRLSSSSDGQKGWSEQETVLLLEGIELHGENWELISKHVGTRDTTACLFQFAKMPLEEALLESVKKKPDRDGQSEQQAVEIPFLKSKNPLMMQIAFVAAFVSVELSAASAQAALATNLKMSEKLSAPPGARLSRKWQSFVHPFRGSCPQGYSKTLKRAVVRASSL